jgi:peptidoglycan hydrolase-like protein with peptidoglycan-binding domain
MSDTWAERFNPNHAPAGSATGGQFAPSGGAKSSGGKPGAKSSHDTRPAPSNAHPVGTGEHGKRVSDLQSRLNALGFKPPLKVDGIFGPKTLAAVRAFQKSHGLKVDGLVGPKTTAALRTRHPAAKHAPAHTAPHGTAKKAAPKPATTTVRRDAEPYGHEHYVARSRALREAAGLRW